MYCNGKLFAIIVSALYAFQGCANAAATGVDITSASAPNASHPGPYTSQVSKPPYGGDGTHILKRQEWRALSDTQKQDYFKAVRCLQQKPPMTNFKGVRSRFDDFQAQHVDLTPEIHFVGQFLPWHRLMVKDYETALREECGYQGVQPYWNWSIDADLGQPVANSPIFDPNTGFGGNGVDGTFLDIWHNSSSTLTMSGWGGGCVLDGPFATFEVSLGPGTAIIQHCLVRQLNVTMWPYLTSSAIANATKWPDFETFRTELEGFRLGLPFKPHTAGHVLVGGDMGNVYSSAGDPIFYMHHANLDRIWWEWQMADPENRLFQITGRSTVDPPYTNVTLDFPINMGQLAATRPIREVMDIRVEPMFYGYE